MRFSEMSITYLIQPNMLHFICLKVTIFRCLSQIEKYCKFGVIDHEGVPFGIWLIIVSFYFICLQGKHGELCILQ